jgi:ubiquinone/menaquinone biosynthesis C-methylase UbiE
MDQIGFDDWRAWVTARAHGRVLEIGVGTGLNFSYYNDAARVVAFDPDVEMLAEIAPTDLASSHFEIAQASAEELPFPTESFDAAVGTLVFCTIPNAPRALAEVRRVLKPGASLRLVEHVRAHNRIVAGVQDVFTPVWKPLAGGCHLNRDTLSTVRAAGYEILNVQRKWRGLILGIDARK